MQFKHDEKLEVGKVELLALVSLLMGLAQAFFNYVMSSYFAVASGSGNVSIFYLLAYGVILIAFLNMHRIVKKIGKSDFFYLSLFLKIVAVVGLLFVAPGPIGIILVMFYIIFFGLQWVGIDMLLEAYSTDKMSGRIRGGFLTAMNLGILLGPLVSAIVLERYGYYGIFLLLVIFNVAIFFISAAGIGKANHRFRGKVDLGAILKKVYRRKNIGRILYIAFILDFFYALTIIYVPIYLLKLGFGWHEIGIILTIMLLPFVFIQYPIGVLADKKLGEKEMLIVAIIIMGISTGTMYFIASKEIFIWALILFATRVGAAMIEILRDSYFYKRIDAHDVDLINIFRTSRPLGYILGSMASGAILLFLPMKSVFVLTAIVILSALIPAILLEDNL